MNNRIIISTYGVLYILYNKMLFRVSKHTVSYTFCAVVVV